MSQKVTSSAPQYVNVSATQLVSNLTSAGMQPQAQLQNIAPAPPQAQQQGPPMAGPQATGQPSQTPQGTIMSAGGQPIQAQMGQPQYQVIQQAYK